MSSASHNYPPCTRCGSTDVLPFEDDTPVKDDSTLFFILLSIALLIVGYVLFIVSSFFLFPLAVFIAIFIITRIINTHLADKKKRDTVGKIQDYVCLDCGGFFKK